MTIRAILATLFLAAMLGVGTSARAAQLGPYVGGFYGLIEHDIGIGPFESFTLNALYPALDFTPSSHSPSLDTEDEGYGGLIGYRISRHFAIEGVFMDLGEVTYRAHAEGVNGDGDAVVGETRLTHDVSGIGVYGLAILPVGYRWEIYARGGIQLTSSGVDGRFNRFPIDFSRESSTDYLLGAGIAMSVAEIYGLRLEYKRIFGAGNGAVLEGDLDVVSLGIIVAF